MKNINKAAFLISFVTLMIACSLLSMIAASQEYRFTPAVINPWSGIEGIAYTIKYHLYTGTLATWIITIGLLLMMWWRIYSLVCRFWKMKNEE